MKKKLNLKLLENADNQTLEDLSENYRAVSEKEAERIFQRVIKNEEDFQAEDDVHGVEIYHRSIWRKAFAVAATFIIIAGVAGGGAYYFSQFRNKNNVVVSEGDRDLASVFEELFENRDAYSMTRYGYNESDGGLYYEGLNELAKEEVFLILEKFILYSDIEKTDEQGTDESIQFLLSSKGEDKLEEYIYKIEVYSNGVMELTEKESEDSEKMYRVKLSDAGVFDTLRLINNEMFVESNTENNSYSSAENSDPEDASPEEVEKLLNKIFETGNAEGSYTNYENPKYNCIIKDKEKLIKELLGFEWSKRTINRTNEYFFGEMYFDIGIRIDINCNIYDTGETPYTVYSTDLSNRDELEDILRENIEIVFDSQDVSGQKIKDILGENTSAVYCIGFIGNRLTYNITDLESLKDEVASLGWVTCIDFECDWGPAISDSRSLWTKKSGYIIGDAYVGLGGYINGSYDNDCYFKLKNKDDSVKLQQILDKYLVPNKYSEMCIKLKNGMNSYKNLKAHYIYESKAQDESQRISISGELLNDMDNNKLYMSGEGKYYDYGNVDIELVSDIFNEDISIYSNGILRISEKDTGENKFLNRFGSGYRPGFEYEHIAEYIIQIFGSYEDPDSLTQIDNRNSYEKELAFDVRNSNGNTEYYIHTQGVSSWYSETEYRILLDEESRLISYDRFYKYEQDGNKGTSSESFVLVDYEFDSPDFTMDDVMPVFDRLENECREQEEK